MLTTNRDDGANEPAGPLFLIQEKLSEKVSSGDERKGVVASSRLRCGGGVGVGGRRKESGRTGRRHVTSQYLLPSTSSTIDLDVCDDLISSLFAFLPSATLVVLMCVIRYSGISRKKRYGITSLSTGFSDQGKSSYRIFSSGDSLDSGQIVLNMYAAMTSLHVQ